MRVLSQQTQEALKADIVRMNELRRRIKQINPDALAEKYGVSRSRIYSNPPVALIHELREYFGYVKEVRDYSTENLCKKHGVGVNTVFKYKDLIRMGKPLPLTREDRDNNEAVNLVNELMKTERTKAEVLKITGKSRAWLDHHAREQGWKFAHPKGRGHNNTKVPDATVATILHMKNQDIPQVKIARMTGVGYSNVRMICSGKRRQEVRV